MSAYKIVLILALTTFSLAQNKNYPDQTYNINNSLHNLNFNLSITGLGSDSYARGFFNKNNLDFTNFENSLNSSLKLTAEISAGALSGYSCAILLKNFSEPDNSKGEDWIGLFWQAAIVGLGAAAGSSGGAFLIGNILGDEGSYKNTFYWSIITSYAFNLIGGVFTKNKRERLIITFIGMPIGAAIGFNSHELFE